MSTYVTGLLVSRSAGWEECWLMAVPPHGVHRLQGQPTPALENTGLTVKFLAFVKWNLREKIALKWTWRCGLSFIQGWSQAQVSSSLCARKDTGQRKYFSAIPSNMQNLISNDSATPQRGIPNLASPDTWRIWILQVELWEVLTWVRWQKLWLAFTADT